MSSNLHDGDASQTRERILDATFRRLVSEGYAALSVREIAKDAGVNHALINYHFRSKDQLVIDVLDAVNQRLLSRQASMYASGDGFAQKWASARRFYEDDLASGFVRLQADGTKLPPPFTPEVIACWISEFWLGMEFVDLLGVKEEQAEHRAALDAVQWLLEWLDAKATKTTEPAVRRRSRR